MVARSLFIIMRLVRLLTLTSMINGGYAQTAETVTSAAPHHDAVMMEVKMMFRDIGNTTGADVEAELTEAMAGRLPQESIDAMESAFRPMYTSLPKNEHDRLGHQAVRYALHRYFVSENSWYIRGLKLTTKSAAGSKEDWVPSYVQDRWESHVGNRGVTLRELSTLALVMQDLIHQETKKRITVIYDLLSLPTNRTIRKSVATYAIDTYTMLLLLGSKLDYSIKASGRERMTYMAYFKKTYKNYKPFRDWLQQFEDTHIIPDSHGMVAFSSVVNLVQDFTNNYGKWNLHECRDLKATLVEHEGVGPGVGRVLLSDFYNMSRHTHWNFEEKAEYLRDLGALDDSNASIPMLIVPNYLTSRPNCLETSPLYSVCCRNECDDLLGSLEREMAAPRADPDRIIEFVASLASDTVVAPRTLSDSLIMRLQNIATLHSGQVDIHSRLFGQWMHNAFPLECPYPHEAGTTNPLSPDEWIKTNGHESHLASKEEIQQVLDQACRVDQGSELLWSHVEEVFEEHKDPPPAVAVYVFFLLTVGLWFALSIHLGRFREGLGGQMKNVGVLVFMTVLGAGVVVLDIVDKEMVVCATILGFGVDVARYFGRRMPEKEVDLLEKIV